MTSSIGRNDPCPCGSGKKNKNCCNKRGISANKKYQNKIALGVLALVVVVSVIIAISKFSSTPSVQKRAPITQPPISSSASTPLSTTQSSAIPASGNQYTPPPPGPAPAGQVWSAEHEHWHNLPGPGQTSTSNVLPGQPTQLTPQPPGPAPEGKVWSPEHGHWHDAPPEVKVIQVNPSNTDPK